MGGATCMSAMKCRILGLLSLNLINPLGTKWLHKYNIHCDFLFSGNGVLLLETAQVSCSYC